MAEVAENTVTVSTESTQLEVNKRVNYELGMILGVDEFQQEQEHFEWHHRLHHKLLHGYGTVCGLKVTFDKDKNEIVVGKGYAVSPEGRLIWQDQDICANLPNWISGHQPELADQGSGSYQIYLKLCYDEELTDNLPVVGQACATLEDSLKPTRIRETYRAELTVTPPSQIREDTYRAFGDLLQRVEIIADGSSPLAEDDSAALLKLVLALAGGPRPGDESPVMSPSESSPVLSPDESAPILLHADTACETMRQVLTIWATEVCPLLPTLDEGDCVLLACIDFNLISGVLDVDSVVVNDCDRPILVPERLLQELFCLNKGVTDHGYLEGLLDDDHPQYLLADGSRPLENTWDVGAQRITNLVEASAPTDAVRYDQLTELELDDLADVEAPAPNDGDVLTWDTDHWEPQAHAHSINDLEDVDTTDPAPTDGDVLTWDTDHWEPQTHAHSINDLEDVDTTDPAPTDGDVLTWDTDHWEPQSHLHSLDELDNVDVTGAVDDQVLSLSGGTWVARDMPATVANLDDLGDVDALPVSNGQVLTYTAGRWTPRNPTAGGATILDELGDVDAPASASADGQILRYRSRSKSWEVEDLPAGDSGNHVLAPFGTYAIVAAGRFNINGNQVFPSYHDLTATPLVGAEPGRYQLTFTGYAELIKRNPQLIVKGTVIDPRFLTFPKEDELSPIPVYRHTAPVFTVVSFQSDFIDVVITYPYLSAQGFAILRDGAVDNFNPDDNLLTSRPMDDDSFQFMVEISAYGDKLTAVMQELFGAIGDTRALDINTATVEELDTLPGIAAGLAGRIIEMREARGRFTSINELSDVSGISERMVTEWSSRIRV
jgi:competence ComEA-like helix-hairpin-helix protein